MAYPWTVMLFQIILISSSRPSSAAVVIKTFKKVHPSSISTYLSSVPMKGIIDLFQPKTDLFSPRALI